MEKVYIYNKKIMRSILILIVILFPILGFTQNKGVIPVERNPSVHSIISKNTFAVVVGISDYQDPDIPDLRFADKDAEAFANYLRSPAGGSLDGDHLKILTNQAATTAQFDAALGWLIDETKEGDQAIIYFSGHGDVETKTRSQQGFLLCWDSPPQAYVSGAYPIFFLKEVVSTLSLQNKARVIIITDACRSGKLAGNSIGGQQLTSQNLSQQFANEIKILSCQPNEYSIEGEQWGGGRGAFSYYLVDGLYGMADANADASINLMEIGRYLDDHVTVEVAPEKQVPMTVGNRTEKLATVFPELLAQIHKGRAGQQPTFSQTNSRGIEDEVLATVDTATRALYHLFKKSLKDKQFLEPAGACADAYYQRLIAEPKLERLHNVMRRNYAAALQDDAQHFVNATMGEEAWLHYLGPKGLKAKYSPTIRLLEKAASLLGPDHYMYKTLMARKYMMEAFVLIYSEGNSQQIIEKLRTSLNLIPDNPIALNLITNAYFKDNYQPDSIIYYAIKAMEQAPNWYYPYRTLSYLYKDSSQFQKIINNLEHNKLIDTSVHVVEKFIASWHFRGFVYDSKKSEPAESLLLKIMSKEPGYIRGYRQLGYIYENTERYKDAENAYMKDSTNMSLLDGLTDLYGTSGKMHDINKCLQVCKKMISLDSSSFLGWNNLGWTYLNSKKFELSKQAFKKAILLDSFSVVPLKGLGQLYAKAQQYNEAEIVYKRAIDVEPMHYPTWIMLGEMYSQVGRYTEAEPVLKRAIALDSTSSISWSGLGIVYLKTRRYLEAEPVFKKAIALDSTYSNPHKHLGMVYFKTNRLEEARESFLKAIELDQNYAGGFLGLAYLLASEGKREEAFSYVEQAISKGATLQQLEADEDLVPLRSLPEWKSLMKKHFPDKFKD